MKSSIEKSLSSEGLYKVIYRVRVSTDKKVNPNYSRIETHEAISFLINTRVDGDYHYGDLVLNYNAEGHADARKLLIKTAGVEFLVN